MLLLADVLAFTIALAISLAQQSQSPLNLIGLGAASLIALLVSAKSSSLYERDRSLPHRTTLDEAPKVFQLGALSVLIAWLAASLIEHETPDPSHMLELWLVLSCLLILGRATARAFDARAAAPERWLFVGDEPTGDAFRSKLHKYAGARAAVVARIDLEDLSERAVRDGLSEAAVDIGHLTRALNVHRTVVALPSLDSAYVIHLVSVFQAAGLKLNILASGLNALGPSLEFEDIDGMTIMGSRQFALSRSSTAVKRVVDFMGALVGLLATAPLMLTIAIAIKLDTRGPVFFRQSRIGRQGQSFRMLKFRTMVRDAESLKDSLADRNQALTGLFKINGDPRITRVGTFLRKTSLDELPQLLNVLRGEMSLVGPRPLIPEEDCLMEEWQKEQRHKLLPGMTGPWQVLGPVRVSLSEMANIDRHYLLNRSTWADIAVLLRTIAHIFGRRGL